MFDIALMVAFVGKLLLRAFPYITANKHRHLYRLPFLARALNRFAFAYPLVFEGMPHASIRFIGKNVIHC